MHLRAIVPQKIDNIVRSLFKSTLLVVSLLFLVIFSPLTGWGQDSPPPEFSRGDPDKYKSAEECGECHELEFKVWEKTRHAIGFKEMHKEDSAKKIAKKLGFRLIKRNSLCIACHFTPAIKNGQLRTISGVSCEACHGPGKDWIDIHNDYGGKEFDHKTETSSHRAKRIEDSRQAGMMRPSDLYPVVENCFQCHLVPNEKLVNVGGHGTGDEFEFVAKAEEIRHNFLKSVRSGSSENSVRPVERLRLMYVVGRTVALEYALKGMAIATEDRLYASSMKDIVLAAMDEMSYLISLVQVAEIKDLEEIVEEDALRPNNKSLLLKAASIVSAATKRFLKNHDGSKLGALDPTIFKTEDSEETIENEPDTVSEEINSTSEVDDQGGVSLVPDLPIERQTEPSIGLSPNPGEVETSPSVQTKNPQNDLVASVLPKRKKLETPIQREARPLAERKKHIAPPQTQTKIRQDRPPAPSPRRPTRSKVMGKKRSTIRPGSKHKTVGPRACGKCHSEQTEWWSDDKHKNTHKRFTSKKGKKYKKTVKIAKLYGVKPSEMAKGTQVCMNCHGTVISSKKKRKVRSGVSCESCHGPAKGYLKPHEDGEKDLGVNRPGYIKGLKLGLVKLKDESVRAKTCASCHYITDKRLISSGHSSGEKFKYAERVKEIKHWESKLTSPSVMSKAYNKVIAARGPVPKVAVVSVPESKSRPLEKVPALPTQKMSSVPPFVASSPIVPDPVQTAPSSPSPPKEQQLAGIILTPPAVQAPPVESTRVSPTPKPEKKQKQPRSVSSEIDEIEEEEEEEEAEEEALEPEQEQAIQALIIRDSLLAINEAIKKLDFGDITFDAPSSIQVNESQTIALILPVGKTIDELNRMIKKDADKIGVEIQVIGRMEARLSGRNFSISTITPEKQTLSQGAETEWKWAVTPTKSGPQKLHATLSALINIGGKSTLKEIRTFDQKVEISAGFAGQAKDYFLNNWQWVWAIAFFSGIAWWRGRKSS